MTIAKIHLSEQNYSFIPSIFDYYLETMIFNPKVDWETFKNYYYSYQDFIFDDIILNDFTELLFGFVDSGDFLLCFNPNIYNPIEIRNMLKELFGV